MPNAPQREKAVQLQLAVTRPREPSFAEGNLGELPLFVLNTQDARPELSKDLERVIDLGVGPDGGRRRLTIMAGSAGYPTMFAALVLQVIIERALEEGLDSPVVYVTRHYIARRLRYRRPQASDFRRIDMACEKLAAVKVKLENTWYAKAPRAQIEAARESPFTRPARGARLSDLDIHGLLDAVHFRQTRKPDGSLDDKSYVKLSDKLFESIKNGYLYPVGLDFLLALNSSVAQRVYLYLAKKDDNGQYVEDLKSFAKKVGLKKTAPSAILDALAPALKQLAGELEVPMRDGSIEVHRFLEEWKVDTASGNIIFRFFRENQRPRQQPAKNEFVAAIERIRAGARK